MALRFYSLLLFLLLPFIFLRLFWKGRKAPLYRQRWKERLGILSFSIPPDGIWLHAVSLGEVNAAQPIVQEIQKKFPHLPLLITTTTATGSAQVKRWFGSSVYHSYLPYDLPFFLNAFFKRVRPKLLLIMETELWPNLISCSAEQKIPLLVLNARLSLNSSAYYRLVKPILAPILNKITHIAAQYPLDRERFLQIGADPEKVSVVGSLKFECHLPASIPLKTRFPRPTWIAASTHAGEEEIILEAFKKVKTITPDVLLLLAPRHPERFEAVYKLCEQNFSVSKWTHHSDTTDIIVINTIGELVSLFGIADIAFIGGSLVPHGGHNILEPALWKLPLIVGPYTANFQGIIKEFEQQQAVKIVENAQSLANLIIQLLQQKEQRLKLGQRAFATLEQNRGALQKTTQLLRHALQS